VRGATAIEYGLIAASGHTITTVPPSTDMNFRPRIPVAI
jgi:hypothetical protein